MDNNEHRQLAAGQFNRCWDLLEMPRRTPEQDNELLTAAFTSKFHWMPIGTETNIITSDWMISRAAAAVGESALALRFAHAAVARAANSDIPDFLRASVMEGLARAYQSAGLVALRDETVAKAQRLVAAIADPSERELIGSQLAEIPQ